MAAAERGRPSICPGPSIRPLRGLLGMRVFVVYFQYIKSKTTSALIPSSRPKGGVSRDAIGGIGAAPAASQSPGRGHPYPAIGPSG